MTFMEILKMILKGLGKTMLWIIMLASLVTSHYYVARLYGLYLYELGRILGYYECQEAMKEVKARQL